MKIKHEDAVEMAGWLIGLVEQVYPDAAENKRRIATQVVLCPENFKQVVDIYDRVMAYQQEFE
jgi:hypothetical protein